MQQFTQTKNEAMKIRKRIAGAEIFPLSSMTKPRKTKTEKFFVGTKTEFENLKNN